MAYYFSPFRKAYSAKEAKPEAGSCPFCEDAILSQTFAHPDGLYVENEHYRWIVNAFPRFEGHTMVAPKRHLLVLEEETPEELISRHKLICYAAARLKELYPGAGFEVFLQTGPGSASSVKHLHWHVVPAQPDDALRSFEKLGHFYTTEEGKEKIVLFPIPITHAKEGLLEAMKAHIAATPYKD